MAKESVLHASGARPMAVRIGKRLRPWINDTLARHSKVSNDPVLDPALFPWIEGLRAHWREIRAEADRVLRHRDAVPPLDAISPDHARIADGGWQSFFLHGYGYRIAQNCARAPATSTLAAAIPGLNSALFSILAPGCHIPRHKGVTKGILTCHLALTVPEDVARCRMRVGNETVSWREGEAIVFDDSQHHEVWNDTDETRVILLIQFARPMTFPGRLLSNLFLAGVRRTSFVQEARRNLGKWEEAYRRAERGE
jgi:ornithine lipid ester-linked acyl 2-hydroxylase